MNEPIHILATCRKPELLPAALLVFRTIRVGFPDSPISVSTLNDPTERSYSEISQAARSVDAFWWGRDKGTITTHDQWIRCQIEAVEADSRPFWICDTDVVFWRKFEFEPDPKVAIAGVWTPEFFEPWTRTRYRERLHTCLMRIDPFRFHLSCAAYLAQFPKMPFRPKIDFISQQWQPERAGTTRVDHFYDTLAMAWHAFGGQRFGQEQIDSFDHLNCATYADLIEPSLDFPIREAHRLVYEDHTIARGLWAKQFEWFAEHKVQE
jgi:hypothetical protein